MTHPLTLLTPAGFAALSSRTRWTALITALTLMLLLSLTEPTAVREPAPAGITSVSATTVSATTVPPPDGRNDHAGLRDLD